MLSSEMKSPWNLLKKSISNLTRTKKSLLLRTIIEYPKVWGQKLNNCPVVGIFKSRLPIVTPCFQTCRNVIGELFLNIWNHQWFYHYACVWRRMKTTFYHHCRFVRKFSLELTINHLRTTAPTGDVNKSLILKKLP